MSDYEKLKNLIGDINFLLQHKVTTEGTIFISWKNRVELFLNRKYGSDSLEYKKFKKISFYTPEMIIPLGSNETILDHWPECRKGLHIAQDLLNTLLVDLKDEDKAIPKNTPQKQLLNYQKVFIVHGHDGELKEAVARLIEKQQNLEAIILSEKANQGKTIIEKIEKHSDVGGAICLFTADDLGREKDETKERSRARQNVVFEAGFFMGKLRRDHVVLLADQEIEMPSDLSGVVYTNTANWQFELLKELNAMGYKVDMNKLL